MRWSDGNVILPAGRRCTDRDESDEPPASPPTIDTTLLDLLGNPSPHGEPDPITRRLADLYRGGVKLERAAPSG